MSEPHLDLERKLRPLADPLPRQRPGDWLAEHHEPGQTFVEYVDARPVRKSAKLHTIYLCLVGDFTEAQRRILDITQDYLALFFDCPVKVQRQIALASVPAQARRTHPSWGDPQVLTGYILHEVLEPERPADALAYLALTASDLWPGKGWNFVFGEANLRERVGVWSIYRIESLCQDRAERLLSFGTFGEIQDCYFESRHCFNEGGSPVIYPRK